MKRILEFADKHPKIVALILGAILLIALLSVAIPAIGTAVNDRRVANAEKEKQEALKREAESVKRELILQGKIEAKDEQINDLTSRIEQSNQRVTNAHNETQSAKANLSKVRSDPPKFNSADDAGRVVEFSTAVRGLYPDSPR